MGDVLIGVGVALVGGWLALLAGLALVRPRGPLLTESLRLLPDLLRLLRRLAADRSLPRGVRVRLGLLLAYLALPIDLVPDVIPVLGLADDAIVAVLVLRSVARRVGRAELRRHWPGTADGFAALVRLAGLGDADPGYRSGMSPTTPRRLDRSGYELEFADDFDADHLDPARWLPYHLPQWSGRAAAAARYRVGDGRLRLLIDADQPPWCPEFDGETRVSSLQTGVVAGPVGGPVGQHRFAADAVVREAQPPTRLYTPRYGLFEIRMTAPDDPRCMVAFWMIGYEDAPEHSAEICVAEIFGRDVTPGGARVGMGVHPFGDPAITDDFAPVPLPIDVRVPHTYSAEWTPDQVVFYVDDEFVRAVAQSPAYPMQFMVGLYEFREPGGAPVGAYPKQCEVTQVRGYRRVW